MKERGIELMEFYFDHEKLGVYQVAIEFVAWSEILLEDCKGKAASAKKHLDEASSSIPNNIAEGNGKWSKKDARSSLRLHVDQRWNVPVASISSSRNGASAQIASSKERKNFAAS